VDAPDGADATDGRREQGMGAILGQRDREILRRLASEVAEIAALPVQQETIASWKALNALRPARPMALLDEVPWHEMDADGELVLQAEDEAARGFEQTLRRTLYAWRHMPADMVVEAAIDVPKVIRSTGFGIEMEERTIAVDPHNDIVSHEYIDQLRDETDVERIRPPELELDGAATAAAEATAHEAFDGILEVRMQGWLPSFELWDDIVYWRGAQTVLFDLADRPEHMHAIASRYTDARLAMLDQLEQKGLLGRDQALIHCTGAWTNELPAAGYDLERPRTRDLWTYGMAQILLSVSPAMFEEFEVQYASRWYARFGLAYYGCCDPLHDRVHLVRRIPNVRKISMSPWAEIETGASAIGRDYVFSWKPNPASVARDGWDPEAAEREMRRVVEVCAEAGCPLEITLKDISTVRYQPQRLWEWAELASRVVRG
jgi:hypothetical protein